MLLSLLCTGNLIAMTPTKKTGESSWKEYGYAYITHPFLPTSLFLAASTKELIKNYRADTLPSCTTIKNTLVTSPYFFTFSSLLLAGCMIYTYYKPLFKDTYKKFKNLSVKK